jgi:hypothetical protein
MTSMVGKLSLVIATAGSLSFMALSPASVEAGVIHQNLAFAAPTGNSSDVVRVRCERSLSNLWSCNDDVRVQGRRDVQIRDRYAYEPCERTLSNLWSCNDDVRVQGSRDVQVQDRRFAQNRDSYTRHPCDHSYEIARDGSRCGNRAADKRPGGR